MGLEREEFAAEVESAFGILLSGEEATRMATPRDLVRFIAEKLPLERRRPVAEIGAVLLLVLARHVYPARALSLDTRFGDVFP